MEAGNGASHHFLSKRKKLEKGCGEREGEVGKRHGPGPVPENVEWFVPFSLPPVVHEGNTDDAE